MVKCCATSCGIAATLIAGMAYCTYMGNRTKLVQDYAQTLTEDQRQIYAKIVEERRGIYLRGCCTLKTKATRPITAPTITSPTITAPTITAPTITVTRPTGYACIGACR